MVKKPIVMWNKIAESTLQKAYREIKIESPQNAIKVRDGILSETRRLANGPEIYPPDKFKRDNPGNYRAFEKYSYRVAYRHTEKEIRNLRIRHVKQEPRMY